MNLSTFTSTSSTIPFEYVNEWSANYNVIIVGLISLKPNFLQTKKDIKLILAPRSHKALVNSTLPILQRIVKLPESLDFGGILF